MGSKFLKSKLCVHSLLLMWLMSFSLITNAQILEKVNVTKKVPIGPQLEAGLKVGANFSYLTSNNWSNGIKSNVLYGAYSGFSGGSLGIQAEACLEQSDYTTGSNFYNLYKNYYNNLADSLKQGTFRVNKLCLPIMLKVRFLRTFWLYGGVQFYGIVQVKDFNKLLEDAKYIYKSGSTAALVGTSLKIGNANVGARLVFDLNNLNNLYANEMWRQYMFQTYLSVRIF